MRRPKCWSFSFSISPSNEYSGLISFKMDWLYLLDVQGILKGLLRRCSLKSAFRWRNMEHCRRAGRHHKHFHHKCRRVSPALVTGGLAWACPSAQAGFTTSEHTCAVTWLCVLVQMVRFAWFLKTETEILKPCFIYTHTYQNLVLIHKKTAKKCVEL